MSLMSQKKRYFFSTKKFEKSMASVCIINKILKNKEFFVSKEDIKKVNIKFFSHTHTHTHTHT
jgi:hypothetical protein